MQHHLVVQDCFNCIVRLREAKDDLPCAFDVHALLMSAMERMLTTPAALGLPTQDVKDIAFVIAALADEVAMRCGENVADMWQGQKLQTQFFNEHGAGDLFYERLHTIRQTAGNEQVLFAYYTALALGFEGRLGDRAGRAEITILIKELRGILEGQQERSSPYDLSPEALANRPDARAAKTVTAPTAVLLTLVAGAVVILLGLQVAVRTRLQQVVELAQMRHAQVVLSVDTGDLDDAGKQDGGRLKINAKDIR